MGSPYTDYKQYIPDAFRRYMQNIYGKGGTKGYVSGQVRGVSASMQPYMEQMNKQGAAGIGGRGGLGGGSQDLMSSNLMRNKIFALQKAGSTAQRDVSQTGVAMTGMAQNEAFKLTDDQIRKIMMELQKKQAWMSMFGDIAGAGGYAAGGLL